jgi:hypothetical protein
MMDAGLGKSLKALQRVLKDPDEARRIAVRSGAIYEGLVHEFMGKESTFMRDAAGALMEKGGFQKMEVFLRTWSAVAGVMDAEDAIRIARGDTLDWMGRVPTRADKANAANRLRRMGVSEKAIADGAMSAADRHNAAYQFSHMTQFGNRPEDVPLTWERSDAGRLITQFMAYPLKLMYYDIDRMVKGHGAGRLKNIMRFLVAAPVTGVPITIARDILWGFPDEERKGKKGKPVSLVKGWKDRTALDWSVEIGMAAAPFGLIANLALAAKYGALSARATGTTGSDLIGFGTAANEEYRSLQQGYAKDLFKGRNHTKRVWKRTKKHAIQTVKGKTPLARWFLRTSTPTKFAHRSIKRAIGAGKAAVKAVESDQ